VGPEGKLSSPESKPGVAREDGSMGVAAVRYSDRPQLWGRIGGLSAEVWPEYNRHGDVLNRYWDRLYEDFPEYQFVLYDDEDDQVLAEGHTIPCTWDGTVEGLGPGIDATIAAGFTPKGHRLDLLGTCGNCR